MDRDSPTIGIVLEVGLGTQCIAHVSRDLELEDSIIPDFVREACVVIVSIGFRCKSGQLLMLVSRSRCVHRCMHGTLFSLNRIVMGRILRAECVKRGIHRMTCGHSIF